MTAPTMAQIAAITAITDCEEHVEQMRQEYDNRRRMIVEGLNYIGFPQWNRMVLFTSSAGQRNRIG